MTVITGWRAALVLVAAVLVLLLLLAAVFWLGIILAVLAVVAWFNLTLLPRVARGIHVPEPALAALLLPVLAAAGYWLNTTQGAIAGAAIWLFGVVAPRVALRRFRRRIGEIRVATTPDNAVQIIDTQFRSLDEPDQG
jgi:hypothetical protein